MAVTTYKYNENGDVIEELEFRADHNNYEWKTEYTYTYDDQNNWLTKKSLKKPFKENGKLETDKGRFIYQLYNREISY